MKLLIIFVSVFGLTLAGCPSGYVNILSKCYYYRSSAMTWNNASTYCNQRGRGGSLWVIDDNDEYMAVSQALNLPGYEEGGQERSGASARYWTDGKWQNGLRVWASTQQPIIFEPEEGSYHACCSGMGCYSGNNKDGDCIPMGWFTWTAADHGVGFLGCPCDEYVYPFVCEHDPY